ncbi:RNA chaperone ProQ [Avibacterium paragallinarum]|uniref:RNA chaperone ProQ n=1 Tax=Avibacterium paragallinarum TaxID=728 RepID=A0AAE5THX5_AVIPA|nr:RNA chaperone ProQ [Avibacterium paragallinarum]PXZ39325.1 RNA chaperone ProQ [Avibacterium paragallinarum]PXZ41518.1 RNA chaperone ProQ [Avibacterium paragallinarum]QZP16490.1 RNA chaperone ProQ [Avibacterium paragallinarum]WAL57862.1 RNA chaperone ProQ [Avibacterium paragallinarum]WAM59816.1 RNA chaperone ProQ [Avibacterium paragallinarum]
MTEVKKLANSKEIIAYLAEKFPLCFTVEGTFKPLKIGIFQDLSEALADDESVSKTRLRQALRQYTLNWSYLSSFKEGAERVGLDGVAVAVVEKEHADYAAKQLAEAKAQLAHKRAAERVKQNNDAKKKQHKKPYKKVFDKKGTQKPALTSVVLSQLEKGTKVKVKAGNAVKNAVVLEIVKDSVRIELDNGLTISVTADRLFV